MKLDITKLSYDARWYNFETGNEVEEPGSEGVVLKIRPHPWSKGSVMLKDGALLFEGEERCRIFKECLVDWQGITGSDARPLPCTDDVKQKLFDFALGGISEFVMNQVIMFYVAKEQEEKNS